MKQNTQKNSAYTTLERGGALKNSARNKHLLCGSGSWNSFMLEAVESGLSYIEDLVTLLQVLISASVLASDDSKVCVKHMESSLSAPCTANTHIHSFWTTVLNEDSEYVSVNVTHRKEPRWNIVTNTELGDILRLKSLSFMSVVKFLQRQEKHK